MIAWAIASLGFSFYLVNFANRGLTYGSLGTAVGLLVYLYFDADERTSDTHTLDRTVTTRGRS